MRAGAFQAEMRVVFRQRVNQQPIRFDMAITAAGEISTQRVILVWCWQFIAGNQQIEDGFELFQILAALVGEFDILLELRCAAECPHRPRSA